MYKLNKDDQATFTSLVSEFKDGKRTKGQLEAFLLFIGAKKKDEREAILLEAGIEKGERNEGGIVGEFSKLLVEGKMTEDGVDLFLANRTNAEQAKKYKSMFLPFMQVTNGLHDQLGGKAKGGK